MSVDFGAQLKTAREEKNISLAQVSETLKLSIEKISDIENSDVKALPPPAFTCGYLRLFSKLVGVDENEIIKAYNESMGEKPDNAIPNATSDIPTQANSQHPGMRLASFSVIILIIILLIVWWNDRDADEIVIDEPVVSEQHDAAEELPVATDKQVIVTENQSEEETQVEVITEKVTIKEASTVIENNSKDASLVDVKEPVVVDSEAVNNTNQENSGIDQLVDEEDVQAEEIINLARKASPVAVVGVDTIQLNAIDDCWVEISDANDHLLYFSLLKKGEEVHLSGQEPFKVFLGKAQAVQIMMNDLEYDVSSYIRSNQVARFTMSMEKLKKN